MEETFAAEQKFAEKFGLYNIKVIKFTDLSPPTRKYTLEQDVRLLKKSGADSIFTVYIAGRDYIESYVPLTYHAGETTSYVRKIGNMTYVNTHTTPGYTTGGYSTSKPIMAIFSSLIDLRNGSNIWQAEGRSSGGEFISHLDLLLDAGDSAIEDIKNKGLLSEVSGKE
ncbi:hypothetical protein PN473_04010 [Dolichospermum circinale CS-545/17]|nr:hypothetical protein [Dolichospermum circinale CS-545/17]